MQSNPTQSNPWRTIANDIYKGSLLGSAVVMGLTPLFYAKNMKMIGAPFSIRDSFRGLGINGVITIPQAALQITIYQLMKRSLYSDASNEHLSFSQNTICAGIAGTASGVATIPGELIVLHLQKNQKIRNTSLEILRAVAKNNGKFGWYSGGSALSLRETIYLMSYTIIGEKIGKLFAQVIGNSKCAEGLGAATAGAIGGALTNPMDVLRVLKQDQASSNVPESYLALIRSIGMKGLFRGVVERSAAVAIACLLMSQGNKLLE
jgi:hypothetical protein